MPVGPDNVMDKTYIGGASISQYAVVVHDGTSPDVVVLPGASGATGIAGVTQESCLESGDAVRVRKLGMSKVIAKNALATIGTLLAAGNTDGRVAAPSAWSAGNGVVGFQEEVASASGDIIRAFIQIGEVR